MREKNRAIDKWKKGFQFNYLKSDNCIKFDGTNNY